MITHTQHVQGSHAYMQLKGCMGCASTELHVNRQTKAHKTHLTQICAAAPPL